MSEQSDDNWWTSPAQSESGRLVMVTGRRNVSKFRSNPKFNIRAEIIWRYRGDSSGMPDQPTSELMEQVHEALVEAFRKDPVAVLTGIYTGDDERNWIFYTLSVNIFGRKLNEALADFPLLPIEVRCATDPDWEEYDEMKLAEIKFD